MRSDSSQSTLHLKRNQQQWPRLKPESFDLTTDGRHLCTKMDPILDVGLCYKWALARGGLLLEVGPC